MKNFFEGKKVIDISMPLNSQTICFPGNSPIETHTEKNASGVYLSTISIGSHSGTHIDAPYHVFDQGETIEQFDLKLFLGPCRVLNLRDCREQISTEDLEKKNIKRGERILLKTSNSDKGYKTFYNNYVSVSPEAAELLADKAVALIGIDFLSIKKRGADQSTHNAFLKRMIPILEGIDLSQVSEGSYTLVCLPLALTGIDGAPARAILIVE